MAVKNLLLSYLIPSPPNLEVVAIKLCFAGNHSNHLHCVHHSKPKRCLYLLVDFLNSFSQSEDLFIAVGDFNCLTFVGPLSLVVICFLTSFVTLCLSQTYISS